MSTGRQSATIVQFIANLYPLYQGENHGDVWAARNLHDGTLILPLGEDEAGELVKVHWQGNPYNATEVLGHQMATLAVARYVELHAIGKSEEERGRQFASLAEHFTFKTGATLALNTENDELTVIELALRAANKLGPSLVVAALKKMLGL